MLKLKRLNTYSVTFFALVATTNVSQLHSASARENSVTSPYRDLGNYLRETIHTEDGDVSASSLIGCLSSLSKSQSTLKTLDGASHEFYQRSHRKNVNSAITGRAERTAGRIGACADALFGCELLDYAFCNTEAYSSEIHYQDTSNDRFIVLNTTLDAPIPVEVVVIFDKNYIGGAGVDHGGINGLMLESISDEREESGSTERRNRGRFFVIIKDAHEESLEQSLQVLDNKPTFVELSLGLVSGEVACVNRLLWLSAEKVLNALEANNVFNRTEIVTSVEKKEGEDIISSIKSSQPNEENLPAIHFIGRSLAGGIASLAALMLDGSIPIPPHVQKRKRSHSGTSRKRHGNGKRRRNRSQSESSSISEPGDVTKRRTLHGFGKLRTSALCLGAPPSISANIKASFITSIIHGDDVICRTTNQSLDRLRYRVCRLQKGNMITKQMGWMTDTLSLTVSSLKTHAHGSEGEEGRLSIAGKAYLIRPRRMKGGVSSIHEVGHMGGREAIRAAVLWQLNDILLSSSMWKHHSLKAYIGGLDRVQLRQVNNDDHVEDGDAAPVPL